MCAPIIPFCASILGDLSIAPRGYLIPWSVTRLILGISLVGLVARYLPRIHLD